MYEPTTILAVTVGLSTAFGAYSSYAQGQQQQKAAEYNAQVAEQNAEAARQKAAYDEKIHRERVRKLLSTQRALYGKSGVTMEGSPLLVMQDTTAQGELDALAIRHGGDIEAARRRSEANLYRMQGKSYARAGTMAAGATLLSGAGKTYGTYKGF